jgi:uncharacterized sulfatase
MKRRHFLRYAATAAAAAGGCRGTATQRSATAAEAAGDARRPNIVFILADDLGYGDLGCYGQKRLKTPHLDRLAAEGVRFTQHYAGSTVCAPSRFTLMTGLHIGHATTAGQGQCLEPERVTVAECLKAAGYATACIGKWGLGEEGTTGVPLKQGFDRFFGYLNQVHAHNYYPAWIWRDGEKVPLRNEVVTATKGYAKGRGGASTKRVDYSHDMMTAEALDFVDRHRGGPFFLYLPYTIPHANNEHHVVGRHGMEVPDYGPFAGEDWPEVEKGFAAMIWRMDRDIGRLIERLKAHGIAQNTLVLFSSDNGPHKEGGHDPEFFGSSGPLRGTKRDLYEGGIRVPTIAWWPGRIAPGRTSDHVAAFYDFLPTACEAAGVPAPAGIDGLSYLPELLGRDQPAHEYLYWDFLEQGGKRAVRAGRWKAVWLNTKKQPDAPPELYDLDADIGETKNVAAAHPDVVGRLTAFAKEAGG